MNTTKGIATIILLFTTFFLLTYCNIAHAQEVRVHKYKYIGRNGNYAFHCTTDQKHFKEWVNGKYVYRGSCVDSSSASGKTKINLHSTEVMKAFLRRENERVFKKDQEEQKQLREAMQLLKAAGYIITNK